MTLPRFLFASAVAGFLTTACVTNHPPPRMPTFESRQSGEWRRGARRIQSGEYTIYYYGRAQRDTAARRDRWTGVIIGDIFAISPQARLLIPDGTLTIPPNRALHVEGASRTEMLDQSVPSN